MSTTFILKSPVNLQLNDFGWHTTIREWRGNLNMHKLISLQSTDDHYDDKEYSQLKYDTSEQNLRYPDIAEYTPGKEYHVGDYIYVEISDNENYEKTVDQPTAKARIYKCIKDHIGSDRWFMRIENESSKTALDAYYKQDVLNYVEGTDSKYGSAAKWETSGVPTPSTDLDNSGMPKGFVDVKNTEYDEQKFDNERNFWSFERDVIMYRVFEEGVNNEIVVAPDGKVYKCITEHIPNETWDEKEQANWEEYEMTYDSGVATFTTSSYETPWTKISTLTGLSIGDGQGCILNLNGRSSYYIYEGADPTGQVGTCICNEKQVFVSSDAWLRITSGTFATITATLTEKQ